MPKLFLFILASWLLGSIPSAFIITKLMTGKDIRSLGSQNAGATNVYRVSGLKGAVPVFLFDFFKGFLPVWIVIHSGHSFIISDQLVSILSGAAAFTGHLFPVFTGFRGGKGVATGAGLFTAMYPPLFPACFAVFITVLALSRKMSPASITTAISLPVWYIIIKKFAGSEPQTYILIFMIIVPAAVIFRHHKNIRNLIKGREKQIF